jgi:ribosome biogenesis GTPase A
VTAVMETSNAAGAARLLRLGDAAEKLGWGQVGDEARDLAARVSEGRFYVACVGQFKRGKSTLINALIGEPMLPVGFTPVTAAPGGADGRKRAGASEGSAASRGSGR